MSRACIFIVLLLGSLAAAQSATIVDVGESITTVAINAHGELAGYLGTEGFTWTLSQGTTLLPPLPGSSVSEPYGVGSNGLVAGVSQNSKGYYHAVIWFDGKIQDLGTLPGPANFASWAYAVSGNGAVTGYSNVTGALFAAFLWTKGGGMRDLGELPGGTLSIGYAVNRLGEVVGYGNGSNIPYHGFFWSNSTGMLDVGTLPGGFSSCANAINDLGQVVGGSDSSLGTHAFLWSNGAMQDLGSLYSNGESIAGGINNKGLIIGFSGSADLGYHAFIWSPTKGMLDLNSLIPPGSGWTLNYANGINDSGQITGTGMLFGSEHSYLLTLPPGWE